MRSHNSIYVHPDLKADEEDVSLVTTICFVLSFAIVGAIFVFTLSCLLRDDCHPREPLAISSWLTHLPDARSVNGLAEHGAKYLSVRQLLTP